MMKKHHYTALLVMLLGICTLNISAQNSKNDASLETKKVTEVLSSFTDFTEQECVIEKVELTRAMDEGLRLKYKSRLMNSHPELMAIDFDPNGQLVHLIFEKGTDEALIRKITSIF